MSSTPTSPISASGIPDQNQVALSQDLVDAFTANQVFLEDHYTHD
jgi:hypothetical protein